MRKKRNRTHSTAKRLQRNARKIGTVAACFVVLAGCQTNDILSSDKPAEKVTRQEKFVNVALISKQKIGKTPEIAADVTAAVKGDIVAGAGGTLELVLKKKGDLVSKGELIAKLSSPDLLLARERAVLAVKSAEDALVTAKRKIRESRSERSSSLSKIDGEIGALTKLYNKKRNDYDIGLATKNEVELAYSSLAAAKAERELLMKNAAAPVTDDSVSSLEIEVKGARLNLQQAEKALKELEVRAPLSGVITDLQLGDKPMLNAGTRIGEIINLDKMKIQAYLNEEAFMLVKGMKTLKYYVPGTNEEKQASIGFLSEIKDLAMNGYELSLTVDNLKKELTLGSKVRLVLGDEEAQYAVTVPTFSIVREGEEPFVFVVDGDKVEKRSIELGRVNEPNQEVLSGVAVGERLVVTGQSQLNDGDTVKIASEEGTK